MQRFGTYSTTDECTHCSNNKRVWKEVQKRVNINVIFFIGDARGVMVIVVRNGHGNTSSILDGTDCISHRTNTLGKGMNPDILPPAMGK